MSDESTALVPIEDYAICQMKTDELPAIIAENMGAQGINEFDLDRVTMPAGGGTRWSVPSLAGTDDPTDLEGVIIAYRDGRVYWAQGLDDGGGNAPPDCTSEDGVTGIGEPGGQCSSCPYAQFGSAGNGTKKGQACKAIRMLFLLRPESLLPLAISLPPTSLKAARNFFMRLTAFGRPYYSVIARIGLESTKNTDSIQYSRATFKVVTRLDNEQVSKMRAVSTALMPQLRQVPLTETATETPTKA